MGMDTRIGKAFLQPGPGFGGSCFPKDTRALMAFAREQQVAAPLIDVIDTSNEVHKKAMVDRVIAACGGSVNGKKLAILGLAFKANTDDVRESPSLTILPLLKKEGALLTTFDPEVQASSCEKFQDMKSASDILSACQDAEAIVILTEWAAFQSLPFEDLKRIVKEKRIIDLRNLYDPYEIARAGFHYTSLGRPSIGPDC
jgi:UDPglucose 6-dehydrogenase